MMVDDDETFLYGSEDEETIPQPVDSAGLAAGEAPEGESDEEGDDSESDLEIILDGEGLPPPRRPIAPLPTIAAEPAKVVARIPTPEVVPPPKPVTIGPSLASLAQVQTSAYPAFAAPTVGEPSISGNAGNATPSSSHPALLVAPPATAAQTQPTLDVNYAPKDANGQDLFDIDIESIEDKAWRRPGANQADWFNYGMNEAAWKNYARKQREVRESEEVANNPFAAFASGNIQEAWQSLAPEMKAVMMATIMGYQPGMNPGMMGNAGFGQMPQMGGQMPQMGYGAPPGMGGMSGGDMGMNGGGFGGGMDYGRNGMMGFDPSQQQGMNGIEMNADGSAALENGENEQEGTFNGQGNFATQPPAAPRGAAGFANRGGRAGPASTRPSDAPARAPLPVREALPANIPTGPRNRGPAPIARKERPYNDKDRGERNANEGLDYGAGTDDSPVPSSRRRERDDDGGRGSSSRRREEREGTRERRDEDDDDGKRKRSSGRSTRVKREESVDIASLTGLEKISAQADAARKIKREAEELKTRGSARSETGSAGGDGDDIIENEDDRRRRRSRRADEEEDRKSSRRSGRDEKSSSYRSSRRSNYEEDDIDDSSSSRRRRDRSESRDDSKKRKAEEEDDAERPRRKASSRKEAN